MTLDHGTVVVTGASSGIGEASALRLDALGFQVFAGVRRAADGDALRAKASDRLTPLLLDVTDPAAIAAAVATVTEAVGPAGIAALVNNAGIAVPGPLEFLSPDDLRRQFEVNVIGQLTVVQAFLPLLRQGHGRIVTMGATSGKSVLPFSGAYSASKHALRAINAALRMELQPWGIAVSIVEPGLIATPIWTRSVGEEEVMRPEERALYGKALDIAYRRARQQATEGSPVEVVVKAVEHAVTAEKPRTHYVVGRNARSRVLVEMLPVRLRDRIILSRVLGRGAQRAP